jgi:hypothetical protein
MKYRHLLHGSQELLSNSSVLQTILTAVTICQDHETSWKLIQTAWCIQVSMLQFSWGILSSCPSYCRLVVWQESGSCIIQCRTGNSTLRFADKTLKKVWMLLELRYTFKPIWLTATEASHAPSGGRMHFFFSAFFQIGRHPGPSVELHPIFRPLDCLSALVDPCLDMLNDFLRISCCRQIHFYSNQGAATSTNISSCTKSQRSESHGWKEGLAIPQYDSCRRAIHWSRIAN